MISIQFLYTHKKKVKVGEENEPSADQEVV